jgi:hypothetical protein
MFEYKYTTLLPRGLNQIVEVFSNDTLSVLDILNEQFIVGELQQSAISGLVQKSLNARLGEPGSYSGVKVIESTWESTKDIMTIYFEIEPTGGERTTVLTPSARPYPGTFYNVMFQYQNVSHYLSDQDTYKELDKETQLEGMKNMLYRCETKLHSNDASFYYQGVWEDLSHVDGAIFGFPGPSGKGIWRKRHDMSGGLEIPEVRITKHIAQVIQDLNNLLDQIHSKLRYLG